MSIIEYTGPSNPQEIRQYLMRRTKDEIVWEYLRQWRYSGEVEAERDAAVEREQALAAHVERLHNALGPKILDWIDCGMATNDRHKEAWARELRNELHQALAEKPETSLTRLKAQCWKEAYLAGMEAGHHWTVEGGYVAGGDEEAAEDYVADRQAEGDAQ